MMDRSGASGIDSKAYRGSGSLPFLSAATDASLSHLPRSGHCIHRYMMTAMLKKNVRPSCTVTSCMAHLLFPPLSPTLSINDELNVTLASTTT
jgi:hypothetical protein